VAVPESLKNLTEIEIPILAHALKKDGLITGRLNVRSVIPDLNSKNWEPSLSIAQPAGNYSISKPGIPMKHPSIMTLMLPDIQTP
jgi:hypothetical protein